MRFSDIVQNGWNLLAAGNFDALVEDYVENMIFIMPGQDNVLKGKGTFREALNNLDQILPPGFEITGLRQLEGEHEVVSILEWKSEKIPSSQLSVLFKFEGGKVYEERWFIDTEQWKSAF